MTFLYRHNSGIWYYRKTYLLQNGKRREIRRSLKTADCKQAQFLALKLYFDVPTDCAPHILTNAERHRLETAPSPPSLSLPQAIHQFLTEKRRIGDWCAKEYRRGEVIFEALAKNLGSVDVSNVGRKESNQFKQALLKSDRSITTVNNYLKRAGMLFDWLLQRGECSENSFKGTNIRQRRIVFQLRDAYSEYGERVQMV